MARAWGFLLGAGLLMSAPAWSHEKRADKCGCHHQYGLRHCHPNKETSACEAPASAKSPPVKKAPAANKRTRL